VKSRRFISLIAAGALAVGVAACGDDDSGDTTSSGGDTATNLSGEMAGAGSSAQEAAQEAWVAGFQSANPDVTISYDPVGSGGGREQFVAGGIAYAGSDAALEAEELTGAEDFCAEGNGELVQIPVYISPIAVIYNLPEVENLQLSPATLAGIFAQEITNWNDPAIAADNPDAELPDKAITPVNRSDESGTTENFADYLSQTAPDTWTFPVDGNWPVSGGEAANGTSGVVEAVTAGDGAIGYADASQAGDLGIAAIKIGDQYVTPSPEGAAAILDDSTEDEKIGGDQYVFAFQVNRTTENPDAYPIVLVSYEIGCTAYEDSSETDLVKGYFDYIISPEGQQAAADNAGSAPLTESITQQAQEAVDAIGAS
jgi:phosphate transport system substrate-binding protein